MTTAGAFIKDLTGVKDLRFKERIEAAKEWDCDVEEICECDRCKALQPFYTLYNWGGSLLFCEICNDEK